MREHIPDTPLQTDQRINVLLFALAAATVVLHLMVGNGYGFHRDELAFLDDARHLAWGYVAYPPITSFMTRVVIAVFGGPSMSISPMAMRMPAALAAALNMVLTGLVARQLGGNRAAQCIAALAASASQVILGAMMIYVVWDYLAWALICYSLAKLLRTGDERWWLAVGASVGVGILSKYSVAFLVGSVLAGVVILPGERHHLRSKWLYLGALLALLMATPNFIWEAQHGWVTLKMLSTIHARDLRWGRAQSYYSDQLKFTMLGLPLVIAGLIYLARNARFRLLLFFYVGPFLLFALAKGRGYYLLPAYTPLYAAGAVWLADSLRSRSRTMRVGIYATVCTLLLFDATAISALMLPMGTPGSKFFIWQTGRTEEMREEIGWPQLVDAIAAVRDTLPPEQRTRLAVLTGDYGSAGAIALYGPEHGLPYPISGVNSFYYRGYGAYEPETVITFDYSLAYLNKHFERCELGGRVVVPYGIRNEAAGSPEIYVCHHLREPWPDFWRASQHFG